MLALARFWKSVVLLAVLVAMGCASEPVDNRPKYRGGGFDTVAVVSVADVAARVAEKIESDGLTREEGIAVGATAGAAAGIGVGLATATACGPYFYVVCAVPAVLGYGMLGGAGGGLIGASSETLTREDANYLREEINYQLRNRDLHQEIAEQLRMRLPEDVQDVAETADVQVIASITGIEFEEDDGDVRLDIKAELHFQTRTQGGVSQDGVRKFRAKSVALSVDEWLSNDGTELVRELGSVLEQIGEKMAAMILAAHARQRVAAGGDV